MKSYEELRMSDAQLVAMMSKAIVMCKRNPTLAHYMLDRIGGEYQRRFGWHLS